MPLSYSQIIDLFLAIVMALLVILYLRKGFLAALAELLGSVGSAVLAFFVARHYAPVLFDRFLKETLVQRTMESLKGMGGNVNNAEISEKLLSFLPKNVVESIMNQIGSAVNQTVNSTLPEMAKSLVDKIIAPILVPLFTILLFLLVFALAKFLIGLLVGLFSKANETPVLGTVNRAMGGLLGLVIGAIDVYLLVCVMAAVVFLTAGSLPFLNTQVLQASVIARALWKFVPFVGPLP